MKKLHVTIDFLESVLGTSPNNENIFTDYIASNAPDAMSREEEIAAIGADEYAEKGMTVFPRNDEGQPIIWDYQIKGFFKDACGMLSRIGGKGEDGKKKKVNESSKLTAYKKIIDGLIFVQPRKIPFVFDGEIGICERPLRAQTMQGERVALSKSEEIPAGAKIEFDVLCLNDDHVATVKEWFDYGVLRGIGQWRNSGKGRFTYQMEEVNS